MKERLRFVIPTTVGMISLIVIMILFFRFMVPQRPVSQGVNVSSTQQQVKNTEEIVNPLPAPTGNVNDALDAVLADTVAENDVDAKIETNANAELSGSDMTDELGQTINEQEL